MRPHKPSLLILSLFSWIALCSKKNMKWEILPILGKTPSSLEQSTVDVLACVIEPKLANVLVRKLNQISPLEDLRHVKRVRRRLVEGNAELSVIVCLFSGHDCHMDGLPEDLLQLINAYQLKPFKAKVAKFAAVLKEEWEEQCKLWPTSYHPPNNRLDGIAEFSDEDSRLIFNYMKVAIQLAKFSCLGGKVVNAAVIVDPSSKQIVTTAIDETDGQKQPTFVSTTKPELIRCNKLPSTLSSQPNGNGCGEDQIPKLSPDERSQSYPEVSCLHPWGWEEQKQYGESSSAKCRSDNNVSPWHPLRHAAMVAVEKSAARDRQLFVGAGSHPNDYLLDPSNSSPEKRQKIDNPEDEVILVNSEHANSLPSEPTRPYLCTGFDMYLVWEPCTMCAMGLVHQRIRRIFYAFPNPNAGALGSVYRLQGEKSLNHHYFVFRILIPENALDDVGLNGLDDAFSIK